jgi:hypothetical protein
MTLKLLYTLTADGILAGALVASITGSSTYAGAESLPYMAVVSWSSYHPCTKVMVNFAGLAEKRPNNPNSMQASLLAGPTKRPRQPSS